VPLWYPWATIIMGQKQNGRQAPWVKPKIHYNFLNICAMNLILVSNYVLMPNNTVRKLMDDLNFGKKKKKS
jgi:hypothetical protein